MIQRTQYVRRLLQAAVLGGTLAAVFLLGANAEQWCPFGGVEALYTYAAEGNMICSLGVSNFFIFAGVLAMTVLARRVFCSHLCPLGTLAEGLRGLGRRLGIKAIEPGPKAEAALRLMKYALVVVILYFTYRAGELIFRGFDPCYALISRHGPDITAWAYLSLGALVVASVLMTLPFCRWLCPLAAVLNPVSRFGLGRVKRTAETCSGCGRCSRACPAAIPVHQLAEVRAARCTSCLQCVDACRRPQTLGWGPPSRVAARWPRAVVSAIAVACTAAAIGATTLWPLPGFVRARGTQAPAVEAVVELAVHDFTCRGRGNYLYYFLDRDDLYALDGYFRIEAWPGPGASTVRVYHDPAKTNADAIRRAIAEPYFDAHGGLWRPSPFRIEGYELPGLLAP